jgi:hypothetical protein
MGTRRRFAVWAPGVAPIPIVGQHTTRDALPDPDVQRVEEAIPDGLPIEERLAMARELLGVNRAMADAKSYVDSLPLYERERLRRKVARLHQKEARRRERREGKR